jgi:hypothetical protein
MDNFEFLYCLIQEVLHTVLFIPLMNITLNSPLPLNELNSLLLKCQQGYFIRHELAFQLIKPFKQNRIFQVKLRHWKDLKNMNIVRTRHKN